jgi:geranyl-CoA carboxylase alpha subunit
MIKAVAGGGGLGMRLVNNAAEFTEHLRSAKSEAKNAFGDATVILERAIVEPRHIEIQVFADRHGNAIHLGERDCSVQRRHQKVIEEAPSPAVSAELRERMGDTAVTAVKAIRYEGAGTLEFLLDQDGNFFFMEMNTRLQVEHPVTEAITGLDLVALQLRVAAGEPLPLSQSDVRFSGHAIEVRLCAEDAEKGFLPQSGVMSLWQMPPQLRVEHSLSSGADIPPFYDSMIAKLVAHGGNRQEALRKLLIGLQDVVALGVKTNQLFLSRCLAHPVFIDGGATTAFIAQNQNTLLQEDVDVQSIAVALSAALLVETASGAKAPGQGRRLTHSLAIHVKFEINAKVCDVALTHQGQHRYLALSEGRIFDVNLIKIGSDNARFIVDGLMESVVFTVQGTRLLMRYRGTAFDVIDRTLATTTRQDSAGLSDGKLRASMNGRVVAVQVAVGDRVEMGQSMVTLEAMKMEHIHTAPMTGTVKILNVALGEQVLTSCVVAEIEIDGGAS